ncbi:hypothetical protein ACWCSD_22835 [Nonomuraea sp. NPDC001684]
MNSAVADDPSLANSDPYGDGWKFRVRMEGDADLISWPSRSRCLTTSR